ncbi:MAG: endonuclease [Paludibacteraceae bacterium]|nr:endonuclease [Paludibacteraceae bacterium]MBP6284868.1 endonuclease [Paludibacteraceae bacterium]
MKRKSILLVSFLLLSVAVFATDHSAYYLSAEGLSQENLKTALHRRTIKHDFLLYDELWNYFAVTDSLSSTRVLDRYSNTEYLFSQSSQMDREHAFPKSWWGGVWYYPVYADLHHLYPSDRSANISKSNNPLGLVSASPSFNNGVSKIGPSVTPGYSGTVFEPADEYKGDFARAYFYVVTTYQHLYQEWDSPMVESNTYPVFTNWAIDLLMEWHTNDPVSQLEIDRNEEVYSFQHNRNPFIDYPELANYIWGDMQTNIFYTSTAITQPTIVSPWQDDVVQFEDVFEDDVTTTTIYVRGLNLTADLSVSITGDVQGYFSVPTTIITANDANNANGFPLVVEFLPTEVESVSAILTVSGGGASSVSVTLSGTGLNRAVEKPEARPISNIEDNAATLSWTAVYKADNYFLDVYKNGTPANTVVLSENFDGFEKTSFSANSQGAHTSDVSDSLDFFMQTKEWGGDKVYQADKTAKLGTSSSKGYLTTPILDLSQNNGTYVVKFDAKRWDGASEKSIILIEHNNENMQEVTLTSDFQPFSYTFTNGTSTSSIGITAKLSGSNRFFIDNISIEQIQPQPVYLLENTNVGDDLFYDINSLDYDTEYFYRVRANKAGDISANSNTVAFIISSVDIAEQKQMEDVVISKWDHAMTVTNNEEQKNISITLYSLCGNILFTETVEAGTHKTYQLRQGVYLLQIGKDRVEKLVF